MLLFLAASQKWYGLNNLRTLYLRAASRLLWTLTPYSRLHPHYAVAAVVTYLFVACHRYTSISCRAVTFRPLGAAAHTCNCGYRSSRIESGLASDDSCGCCLVAWEGEDCVTLEYRPWQDVVVWMSAYLLTVLYNNVTTCLVFYQLFK